MRAIVTILLLAGLASSHSAQSITVTEALGFAKKNSCQYTMSGIVCGIIGNNYRVDITMPDGSAGTQNYTNDKNGKAAWSLTFEGPLPCVANGTACVTDTAGDSVACDNFGVNVLTVPTLGEWGLLALALSVLGAGVFVLRRQLRSPTAALRG